MATGLGGFFQGLNQGFNTGLQQQMAIDKNKRESDLAKVQLENARIDLEAKKKEQQFQAELSNQITALRDEFKGGATGGEVEDEFGQSLGVMEFKNAGEAEKSMKSQGLRFKQGTTIEQAAKPMDGLDFQLRAADIINATGAKFGKIDLNTLKQAREFRKQIKSEGAIEALRYAMTNPTDQEGIRKIFNEKGDIKLGEDVQIGLKQGMFGPTVYGFRVGEDGKQIEVFDGFRDIVLPSMSPEAYAQTMAAFKQTEVKETGETYRNERGLTVKERIADKDRKSNETIAANKAAATGGFTFGDEVKGLDDSVNKALDSISKDLGKGLKYDQYERLYRQSAADARMAMETARAEGKALPHQVAMNRALLKNSQEMGIPVYTGKK